MINYSIWTDVFSGSSREDFTMAMLAKFQKKLSSAKEKSSEKSYEEEEQSFPTLDNRNENDDDEDWWAFFYSERRILPELRKWKPLAKSRGH